MLQRRGDAGVREADNPATGVDRRLFLQASVATLLGLAATVIPVRVVEAAPWDANRREQAFAVRRDAALRELQAKHEPQATNGDLERYPSRIGSYSKGLAHDDMGQVEPAAFAALLDALQQGTFDALEEVPLGGKAKLSNPLAAYAFDLEGADSHTPGMPAPPAFSSAAQAAEMAELYWQAMMRDVPFGDYAVSELAIMASEDLSAFSAFTGPKEAGKVTPAALFRGESAGDLVGPYVSQFLVKDVPYGTMTVVQHYKQAVAGVDFMTDRDECLSVLSGGTPTQKMQYESWAKYVCNERALGEFVHRDYSYQTFLDAAQILLSFGSAAFDAGNPYLSSKTQGPFITFGPPHVLDFVARVANSALKAAWYQKWLLHLRARPEQFAMHVDSHLAGHAVYPISPELFRSSVLDLINSKNGTYLLPMAYPEGCPTHPSYPAGHATIAGACATVLKAFFNESFVIPNPEVPSTDGKSLEPYEGPALTLGNEIDKLASNAALARNAAGVHWRSDSIEGIRLGEKVALRILADFRDTYPEQFSGWELTTYDGVTMKV